MSAHVTDGKFDTQGTVSMGGVTILDYITTGKQSTHKEQTHTQQFPLNICTV